MIYVTNKKTLIVFTNEYKNIIHVENGQKNISCVTNLLSKIKIM